MEISQSVEVEMKQKSKGIEFIMILQFSSGARSMRTHEEELNKRQYKYIYK